MSLRETTKRSRKDLINSASVDPVSSLPVDLLLTLKALTTFDRNGLDLVLEFTALGMPTWTSQIEEWVFELTKRNMKTLYEETAKKGFRDWRWSDSRKREELFAPESRFIIAREREQTKGEAAGPFQEIPLSKANSESGENKNTSETTNTCGTTTTTVTNTSPITASSSTPATASAATGHRQFNGRPLAFISFRLVSEGPLEVLYVYELQLEPETQRKGLGRHLMTTAELAARKAGFQAVMLTVLKKNSGALDFYTQKMKYEIDNDSPSQNGDMRAPYEILSKIVDRKGYTERMRLVEEGVIDEEN